MKDNNLEFTPKSYLKTMSTIHLFFMFGLIAFLTATIVLNENHFFDYSDMSDPFIYLVPIFSVSGYFLINLFFKSTIKKIDKDETFKSKLSKFQSAILIRFAFIEGPALLGTTAFFISGNTFYILFVGLLITYFFTLKPSKERLMSELNLYSSERSIFNKENEKIE